MKTYKEIYKDRNFLIQFAVTIILQIVVLMLFSKFLLFVEARPGVTLDDPIFHFYNAVRFDILIFILIYGSIITGFIALLSHPKMLLIAVQSYILIILFRMLAMYLTPLEPPIGTLNLQDPLVFIAGTGSIITKDLFFSGHTSMLFLLFLTAQNKILKYIFLILLFVVPILLLLQKAHYSIDILVALFFSFASFKIISFFHKPETEIG